MKNFTKYLLVTAILGTFGACIKKKDVGPSNERVSFNIVDTWKVTNIQGTIDSVILINNKEYKTTFKTSYDSVSQQMKQTYNDKLFTQFPYSLNITFNADHSNKIAESMTLYNGMGVATPYDFNYYSTWNYTTTAREADGLVIKGFDNTHVLGLSNINPAQGTTRYIGALLNKPFFTTYDVRNGHLMLFVHVVYTGNPDTPDGNGGFYNPFVTIKADYEITFSRK